VRLAASLSMAAMLSACVVPPPQPARVADVPPPPPPNTDIYAYPLRGQSPDQVDRDRYECYVWATRQSGFDPSAPNVPPHDRIRVLSGPPGPPPGTGTAVGAITGALLGAAVSRDAGAGLLVGGLLGGAVGTAAEASANQQAQANAYAVERAEMRRYGAQLEQQAANFRRAAGACLDARGYSVR
jgi:hypothetical protein